MTTRFDRLGKLVRRGGRSPVATGGSSIDLAAAITAAYASAGWVVPAIFLTRSASDYTLVSGGLATWVNHGTGSDATQATGTARPTYSATAINGLPGFTFDGGDWVETGSIDTSSYSAWSVTCVMSDTDTANFRTPWEYGRIEAGQTGITARTNVSSGMVDIQARGNAGNSIARSSALDLASPTVLTGTWDTALATNETLVRADGMDVTASHPTNADSATGIASSYPIVIGARWSYANAMTGAMGAFVLAAGSTAIPTTAVAEVEALLAAQWGL